jgi:hypothetical protein
LSSLRFEGILFLVWIFEFYLNREGCFDSPYSYPISPHCGIYLFLKKGAADIVAWAVSPSRDTGVSETMRKNDRRGSLPESRPEAEQNSVLGVCQICPER